jgi:transcriptional regulator with XRE-family HTH domain
MSHGLDFSKVRFETDYDGKRLTASVPYDLFSDLVSFYVGARLASTMGVETAAPPIPAIPADRPPPFPETSPRRDTSVDALATDAQAMQEAGEPSPDVMSAKSSPDAFGESKQPKRTKRYFYREFIATPPAEVVTRIACGTYFTRAWREYRGLSLADAAELYGADTTTILWHESGKNAPTAKTLQRLAEIYDAPIDQFTPRPGSDSSPFVRTADTPRCGPPTKREAADLAAVVKRKSPAEPRSPADTEFPDAVIASLREGKSPMLAWRLYRRLTLQQLAEQYGGRASNIATMERQAFLRRSTVDKLSLIFHCKPEQLYRPAGMPSPLGDASEVVVVEVQSTKPRQRAVMAPEVAAIGDALQRAQSMTTDQRSRRRRHLGTIRLAQMQKDLSRL